jgi:hypothetical protein
MRNISGTQRIAAQTKNSGRLISVFFMLRTSKKV